MTNEEIFTILWALSAVLGVAVALYLTLYTDAKGELVGIVLLSGIAAPAVVPIALMAVAGIATTAVLVNTFNWLRNQRSNK